ncbi:hypothetical protein AN219_09125, partial [Streptomyces nanshensis]
LVGVNSGAVLASTVGPWLLGGIVDGLAAGREDLRLGRVTALFALALLVQTVFTQQVRVRGAMLGEEMLADLREDFLVRAVGLPPGVLERAGTGDLLSRITTDIDRLADAMRKAVPQLAIGLVWAALLGTGDLLSRITTDIDRLADAMRKAVPQLAIGLVWAALLVGALCVTAPPLALTVLLALPVLLAGCRWYFRRAPHAYRAEAAG